MNVKEFMEYIGRGGVVEGKIGYNLLYNFINKYIKLKDVMVFYPKNVFTGQQPEICFFTESKLMIVNLQSRYKVDLKVLEYRNISKIELVYENEIDHSLSLLLNFTSGDEITLNTSIDTTPPWNHDFHQKLEEAFNIINQ